MEPYIPTEYELINYVQMAYYCSFKKDISRRSAQGVAYEILGKSQKPPVYICDFHKDVEKMHVEGSRMPIHIWLREVIKRK